MRRYSQPRGRGAPDSRLPMPSSAAQISYLHVAAMARCTTLSRAWRTTLDVTIGIVPLGSANALGRHLGLSFDPAEAIRQQLAFSPRTIPLGRVTCAGADGPRSRYFAVMAGAGPDGMLVYRMLAKSKHRLGRSMYYIRAARLFLGSRFPNFSFHGTFEDGTTLRARGDQCDGDSHR